MKLGTYLSIGMLKQIVVNGLQLLIFKLLAQGMVHGDFDSYILLLGVLAVSNSLYSIIINTDSVFISDQKSIGDFNSVIKGSLFSLFWLIVYLCFTVVFFGSSAYLSLLSYGASFCAALFVSLIIDGAINRYLFFLSMQHSWYKLWFIEILRPLGLFVILKMILVKTIYGFILVYLGVLTIQIVFILAWKSFSYLFVDKSVQRKRALGFAIGSIHYSTERELLDSGVYSLTPVGLFSSFGVLVQFSSLFKSINRMLNRYFMKDILLGYTQRNYSKVIKVSSMYVALLMLPVIIGYLIFLYYGNLVFTFMNVAELPQSIVSLFFLMLVVESLSNPLTTLILGMNRVYRLNLLLLSILVVFRVFSERILTLDQFLLYFIGIKALATIVGYIIVYISNNEESNFNLRI